MKLKIVEDRDERLVTSLLEVWEGSVRATHLFLSGGEIDRIREYVPEAIEGVQALVVAFGPAGKPVGFMGVENGHLEMLFIAEGHRGEGVGRALLQYGIDALGVTSLAVNEQNPQACGFYKHMGFEVYGRSDFDEQGQPYPILRMRLTRM